jgi:hypothetical protein
MLNVDNGESTKRRHRLECQTSSEKTNDTILFSSNLKILLFFSYFSQKLLDIWPMYQSKIFLGALPFSSDQISLLSFHSPFSFSNID